MKKILIISFLFFSAYFQSHAQFEMGIVGGVSSTNLTPDDVLLNIGNGEQIKLTVLDSDYGFHFGFYTRLKAAGFYLQPSFIFNSNTVDYQLEEISDGGIIETIASEKYQYLDIPVLLGTRFLGLFRLQAGPVGHVFLDSSSDLIDFEGYGQKFKEMTFGYQAGFGLDLFNFRFDVNYEGNFSKYGDHIVIGGEPLEFSTSPDRWVFTFGLRF